MTRIGVESSRKSYGSGRDLIQVATSHRMGGWASGHLTSFAAGSVLGISERPKLFCVYENPGGCHYPPLGPRDRRAPTQTLPRPSNGSKIPRLRTTDGGRRTTATDNDRQKNPGLCRCISQVPAARVHEQLGDWVLISFAADSPLSPSTRLEAASCLFESLRITQGCDPGACPSQRGEARFRASVSLAAAGVLGPPNGQNCSTCFSKSYGPHRDVTQVPAPHEKGSEVSGTVGALRPAAPSVVHGRKIVWSLRGNPTDQAGT